MYFQKYDIDNVRDPVPILPWYQKWCCSKIFNNKKRTSPLSFRWARGNSLIVRVIRIAREFYFCHFAYLPVLKILQWSRLTCVTGESKKSPWASWSCYTEGLGGAGENGLRGPMAPTGGWPRAQVDGTQAPSLRAFPVAGERQTGSARGKTQSRARVSLSERQF